MKVLILGAKGMLGSALVNEFDNKYIVIPWDKEECDITDKEKISRAIKNETPDIVINAAAYTDVDGAESNQALAMKINGEAVGYLAKASKSVGALFIHISTDYVFDGRKKEGYTEKHIPKNPLNIYGKSKLLGEQLLFKEAKKGLKYYLIRTSWLFGPGGKNFVNVMFKLAKENKNLRVVDDQSGKPTYSKDFAKTIRYMIEENVKAGIYHFTNEPELTRHSLTKIIFKIKKDLNPNFLIPKVLRAKSREFPRAAKRPQYSVLLNTKLPRGRNIQKVLKEYLR